MTTEQRLRASSGLLVALWLALTAGTTVSAHRLDEYLQAARIDLQPDRVSIDLDLTPGAEIAASVIAAIDRDRDGVASIEERNGYAADVVRQLEMTLDGTVLPLRLMSSTFPEIDALRAGEGTVRLHIAARHVPLAAGRHELSFTNRHLSRQSVYLANALVPATSDVAVVGQRRTTDQRELTIAYIVRPKSGAAIDPTLASAGSSAALFGLVAALLIARYTRRNGARP